MAVTTGRDVDPRHLQRAALLAARFSCPLLPRGNLEKMAAGAIDDDDDDGGFDCFYVVRRACEELRHEDGRSAHVQPGMMPTKLQQGRTHPFLRAVLGSPDEQAADPVTTIFDGTLGLANDAVHLAAVSGAAVTGVEASPWLYALLEEGLPRIAASSARWASAAGRVRAIHGDSADVLAGMPNDSVDVVVLDPMMSRVRKSAPAFDLLREFAKMDRASPRLLREARRVARRRVVLKLGKGAPLPVSRSIEFPRHELGAHVAYWLHQKGTDPVFSDDDSDGDVAASAPAAHSGPRPVDRF